MSEPLTAAGALVTCPHRWQPSKTDAEGTCYEYACWRCGGTKRTLYGDALARAEAAARAVDEALSVRKVADALVACAPWVESAGDAWHVQVWLDEDVMRIFEDGSFAAALVAHLRGEK